MKMALEYSNTDKAKELASIILNKFDISNINEAEVLIIIGGDGQCLRSIRGHLEKNISFFGINAGNVGFLMNKIDDLENLIEIIKKSVLYKLPTLELDLIDKQGFEFKDVAINELSILRRGNKAAKFNVFVDNELKISNFTGDGIIVSTTTGSTAYNFSAGGPILPYGSNLLSIMPICPIFPNNWRGALLLNNSTIEINIDKNSLISACADNNEIGEIKYVKINQSNTYFATLLFKEDMNIDTKIKNLQFGLIN